MKEFSIWIFVLILLIGWVMRSSSKSSHTAEDNMSEAFAIVVVFGAYVVAAIIRFFWIVIEAWSH